MNEIARLQDLLQRTYSGVCFHGDSIAEIFNGVTLESATWVPDGGAHSIWQIVLHMTGWLDIIRQRITSPSLVVMPDELNFPAPPKATLENLSRTFDGFRDGVTALSTAIGEMPPEQLERMVPGRGYNFATLLHGAVHHSLYHAGQIALLNAMYSRHKER